MTTETKADYRGIPTPTCPGCGSNWFRMTVIYDELSYAPFAYNLEDAECAKCGALVSPATPMDRTPYAPCSRCGEDEGIIQGLCFDCDEQENPAEYDY